MYDQCYIVLNSDIVACLNWKYQRFIDRTGIKSSKAHNYKITPLLILELKQTQGLVFEIQEGS